MAKTSVNFKTETQLGLAATALTGNATAGTQNIVLSVTFFNQSTTLIETVKLYRYATASGISDNSLVVEKQIFPRKTWNCIEAQGRVVENGYSLAATTTTAATVNAECDGVISS